MEGHTALVHGVAWDKAGKCLATGSSDNTAIIWDMFGCKVDDLRAHEKPVLGLVWGQREHTLWTGSADRNVAKWVEVT